MYKAIIEIGGYKIDDIVPDDKAKVWSEMYKVSPVRLMGAKEPMAEGTEPMTEPVNDMLDDYLNRNKHVVKKNLENDTFDINTLEDLLKIETANKNRSSIIDVLGSKVRVMRG